MDGCLLTTCETTMLAWGKMNAIYEHLMLLLRGDQYSQPQSNLALPSEPSLDRNYSLIRETQEIRLFSHEFKLLQIYYLTDLEPRRPT